MRLVEYDRVSTDRQAEDGYGLGVQRAAVREWAKAHGHVIVARCVDAGTSGALVDRDGWADAEAAIRDGSAAGVVVYKLDRLARDLLVQEQLMGDVWRAGGEVFSTATDENNLRDDPEDPTRKLIRRVIGAVSEYEREMVVLRMRRGRRHKAARGGYAYGSPPFGYRAEGGVLVADPTEQKVLRRLRKLSKSGLPTRAVAATLNAEGAVTKRGRSWTSGAVSDVLTRDRLAKKVNAA